MTKILRQTVIAFLALAIASGAVDAATLRIGLSSLPPANGNPFATPARTTWYVGRAYFDMLTQLGPGMRPEPALALSWRNVDPLTWIVTLRPDVMFSNGEAFDAEAVVVTYNYLKTPEAVIDIISQEVENIASVRAVDKLTVEFKTKTPDPGFARTLAVAPIVPPALWRKVGREGFLLKPVGTGSFQVESWEKTRVILTAFKGSWRKPILDGLEIIALPEQSSRIQGLLSGRIDIASAIGTDDVDALKDAGFKVYQRPGSSVDVTVLNSVKPGSPFKDVRVRQAVNYAVNREAIARVIFHDMVPPATQTASRNNPDYDQSLKGYPYDPAKAKALLTEAGYPNGLSFVVEMPSGTSGSELPAAMQQVASDLAKVGVKMEIRALPLAQWQRNTHLGDFQTDAFNFEYETLPTGDTLRPYRLHSCALAHPWFCDQAVMPMIAEAKATFDPARRSALIKQILARTDEQAPVLFLFESLGLDGVSPKVENYSQDNGIIPFAQISIRK